LLAYEHGLLFCQEMRDLRISFFRQQRVKLHTLSRHSKLCILLGW